MPQLHAVVTIVYKAYQSAKSSQVNGASF